MAIFRVKAIFAAGIVMTLCGGNLFARDTQGASAKTEQGLSTFQQDGVNREVLERARDYAAAAIKSRSDLIWYVGNMPKSSPLEMLSNQGRARFLNSLSFGSHGLSSYSYADLQAELTASQIYRVLSLFGVQRSTPLIKGALIVTPDDRAIMAVPDSLTPQGLGHGSQLGMDHDDYRCLSRGTCESAYTYICTSNC
jgi:hypothetical protein